MSCGLGRVIVSIIIAIIINQRDPEGMFVSRILMNSVYSGIQLVAGSSWVVLELNFVRVV